MRSLGGAPDHLKKQLTSDFRSAEIAFLDRLILGYAEMITLRAHAITRDHIDSLRAEGLTDLMLHDIVQVTAYFNYVNRIADGLGVELEHP